MTSKHRDQSCANPLQIKLEVTLKRRNLMTMAATGMFIVFSIIVPAIYKLIGTQLQTSVPNQERAMSGLLWDSVSNILFSYFIVLLIVALTAFLSLALLSTSLALLSSLRQHIVVNRDLKEDNICEWVRQAYDLEKYTVHRMTSHMHYAYALLMSAVISGIALVLVLMGAPAIRSWELDPLVFIIIVPFFFSALFIAPVWHLADTIENEHIRRFNYHAIRATIVLLLIAIVIISVLSFFIDEQKIMTFLIIVYSIDFISATLIFIAPLRDPDLLLDPRNFVAIRQKFLQHCRIAFGFVLGVPDRMRRRLRR